jgi:hypothetical protein
VKTHPKAQPEDGVTTYTFRLPRAQYDALKDRARSEHRTPSAMLRVILGEALDVPPTMPSEVAA